MEFTVNKEWLVQQLENKLVKVVDCRFETGAYAKSHIPGAVYFDLEKDLSSPMQEHGGRHPLPDVPTFQAKLEQAGISNDTTVVVYDSGNGEQAGRFWWLLSYLGHDRVSVLDGGFHDWVACEFPVSDQVPNPTPAKFFVTVQEDMLATYEEVLEVVEGHQPDTVLIDSRSEERYLGEEEPIDPIPGHIPGAVNHPWQKSFKDGSFKNSKAQQDRFAAIGPETPVITYCGSGITATSNFMALKAAGFKNVKMYAGSYSDWLSHPESPIAVGDENPHAAEV